MSARERFRGDYQDCSYSSGREATSEAAHTTQLVWALASDILSKRHNESLEHGGDDRGRVARVQGVVRLCVRILSSHIGEPLMLGDESSVCQIIRTRLVKTPSSSGNGVGNALRFDDLQRRVRLLGCVKNRSSILHLLLCLADSGKSEQQRRAGGLAEMPPRIFAEPAAGLSGIDRVSKPQAPVSRARAGFEEGGSKAMNRGGVVMKRRGGRTRGMSEVTERTLLRGILYAFQGIDSQHIKFSEEAEGYVLDPSLRLGRAERSLVRSMLEMGWLFTEVVRYMQKVESGTMGGGSDIGPGRIQQAFIYSLKEDMTEYYRLIAVLGAQLNMEAEQLRDNNREMDEGIAGGGTEGLTLRRLAVWVMDPLERLKLMATLTTSASHLKGGPLMSCLHTHMQHGDAFVRGLVRRTMVRVCEPLFYMIRNWVFEGELVDHHREFFVELNPLASDEMLWQERYGLNSQALPKFIEQEIAEKILVIGKAINFLRRLCGDSEWIMGPMAKAAAQAQALEYGDTASLQAVVDSCSTLTNARLVHLMLGPYRLKSHLSMLKKFLLHGQGDLMLTLVEVLGAELNKKASMIYLHNLTGIVEGVIKASSIAQEEPEDVGRVGVKILTGSAADTGWQVFSLVYSVESPISAVVHSQAMMDYRRVFHLLWRIKRVEWSLASAWRLHTSATHVRVERALPDLSSALHRCSMVRGQMVFLTTNLRRVQRVHENAAIRHSLSDYHQVGSLFAMRGQRLVVDVLLPSNYMMFEVLETSWGALQERLESARTLDDIIGAHNAYLSNIHSRALLNPESSEVMDKLTEVLSMIVEFCGHQESLIIRAMAEVTTQRAERAEIERRTKRGQWGSEAQPRDRRGAGRDPYGMSAIEDTARRYEEAMSDLVCMLEQKSAKTEILRFLTFRLDFNDYYKGRRALILPPPPRRTSAREAQTSQRTSPPSGHVR